jgi:hypothetical protein
MCDRLLYLAVPRKTDRTFFQSRFAQLAIIKHELETLSGRQIDIALKQSVEISENWIRCNKILQAKQVIYEQK